MAAPGGFYIAQPSPNGLINPAATTPWTQPPTRPTLLDELKTRTAFTTWSILKKTLAAVQLFYFLLLFIYFLLPFASEAYIKSVLYSDEEEYRKRENEFGKKLLDITWRLFLFGGSAVLELLFTINDWYIPILVVLVLRVILTLVHLGFTFLYLPFIALTLLSALVAILLFCYFYYELGPKRDQAMAVGVGGKMSGTPAIKVNLQPNVSPINDVSTISTSSSASQSTPHISTGFTASPTQTPLSLANTSVNYSVANSPGSAMGKGRAGVGYKRIGGYKIRTLGSRY